MKYLKLILFCVLVSFVTACQQNIKLEAVQIIPEPLSVVENEEDPFIIKEKSSIVISDSTMLPAVRLLQDVLNMELPIVWKKENTKVKSAFVFQFNSKLDSLTSEGYSLHVSEETVVIGSAGPEGLFYAVETIRQLLPAELEQESIANLGLPAVDIVDSPRFPWRGMHLDVSRHFMPLEFIKKYIDYLAMHKLNVFHWHLVDGIGWRIEIKSHPELTDIGAWRVVKEGKKPWQDFEVWKEGDDRPKYGGFYTQEEIKEVVKYAQERFITVLPEIELPGHSEVVFQCYPDLGCKDSHGKGLNNGGVYCASNSDSYKLLEDILDEVIDLFPSEFIHIGGDEVNKTNWKNCADCQTMMKKNGYDPHELQSHFVNHFDEYLKAKGRKLIGWHEILEGKLSPSATIMYWGGENGVASHLEKGHPMVLTTGSPLYFDHYQSLSKNEPKAFGGYASLKKVYNYEPVPEGLTEKHRSLIMGVQANVWTEYMKTPEHVEYMTLPRMAALAEIAWQEEGTKDWATFRSKMDRFVERYQAMGANYAKSAFRPDIQFELNKKTKHLNVSLETDLIADIYYSLDGTEPTIDTASLYAQPFVVKQSGTIKAIAVKDGNIMVEPETKDVILHKAVGTKVELKSEGYGKYKAKGGYTLVDADFGGDKWGNGRWLGVLGKDLEAIVEFDSPTEIQEVGFSCIEETAAGIYFPAGLEVAVSNDGKNFENLKSWKNPRDKNIPRLSEIYTKTFVVEFQPKTCKYLRVKAQYQKVKNQGVFIFIDELIVE